jgi:hypothetical protein
MKRKSKLPGPQHGQDEGPGEGTPRRQPRDVSTIAEDARAFGCRIVPRDHAC